MILYHKHLDIEKKHLRFKKGINYSKDFLFIPIEYKGGDILIQTPKMSIPFNMKNYNGTKNYIDLYFQYDKDGKSTSIFLNNLEQIFLKVKSKYTHLQVNHFIREGGIHKWMRVKIDKSALFFNHNKEKINTIKKNTYGEFIISLSGIWIINKNIWFNWSILQCKIYVPIQLNNYQFFDEENLKIPLPPPLPPPPPPPPPLSRSSSIQPFIRIKRKKIEKEDTKDNFIPSIDELKLALQGLKKHI